MQELIVILVDGLVFSSYLFMVAVGLTVIFGVMKILNVTHGSFYAFGAYMSATLIGAYYETDWPEFGGFLAIFAAALIIGVFFGIVLERGLLRFLYHRDEHIIVLATFAMFLVLEDVLMMIWGTDPYYAYEPMALLGIVDIAELTFDVYSLTLIGLAAIVGLGLWLGLTKTKWGKLLLAVIFDREISQAMGINVTVVFTVTFVIGAIMGALGGAYIAPTISVSPGIGVEVIVLAFAVVVIGGMGSIPGAMIGAVLVGVSRAAAVHKFPEIELFVIYAIMALVLAIRPEGLFAPAQARKI
ncbi:MAG: branched-chain amino acid ABC transporter permease [Rhodospirillaceae bacterium]|nr:branched-chain amino acid ABC transporter permease [Rhodospirillaceae bacterium]MBT4044806.1 branched-chain amino acid ABC transporter permease [Rhodospirillaceae bacterium]MBT4687847.1 branched-chain amino acid ABC transporter permease [Rhodospirillaceae bacterium]MBT5080241.1 branched-chain amino acid ABC transporter permease [Rhodospirillaceae bacterium]MBT5527060.1 branched-chain amino acid ABC transporter permease [Rhodospirillaceae bacterium]